MRIVLVVADSLRADAPSYAGGDCRTPFLDTLARQGVCADGAYSSAAWTVPSIAAMLRSVHAHRTGLYRWEQPIGVPNLFTAMARAGYQVASFVFDPDYLFVSSPESRVVASSQAVDPMIEWIERCDARDLFVFVHVWSTHFPYVDRPMSVRAWKQATDALLEAWKSNPGKTSTIRALYRRAVERFSERLLPRIAAAAGARGQQSLVVITADHGESWGERGNATPGNVFDLHGNHLHDEALCVPLVMWGPGWLQPGRIAGLVRSVDIAPTLAQLAGCCLEGAEGRALQTRAGDAGAPCEEPLLAVAARDFVTSTAPAPASPAELWTQMALRGRQWKLLWTPATGERRVYRIASDPGELKTLAPGSGEPAGGWELLRREWQSARCAPPPDIAEVRLRRLGYIE
jgi:arylsulfatase A-like enzyme